MPINIKNFLLSKNKKSKTSDFQDLEHIDGVAISANQQIFIKKQEMIWFFFILEMEPIMRQFILNQR